MMSNISTVNANFDICSSRIHSLKYQSSKTSGFKNKRKRKLEFEASIQLQILIIISPKKGLTKFCIF